MKRLLESVLRAAYPDGRRVPLVISIDECDKSDAVAAVAEKFDWPHGEKIIRRFSSRQGLRSHVLQCGDLSEQYGAVIILEDDLVVAPGFYEYVLQALDFYGDDERICGISLYSHAWNGYANAAFLAEKDQHDAFLGQFGISWGQCWSFSQWRNFRSWYAEHDGCLTPSDKVPSQVTQWPDTSWGKYFTYFLVYRELFYVIPYCSMTTNFSEVGQHHLQSESAYQVALCGTFGRALSFPSFEAAVKYDIFFERMDWDDECFNGLSARDICVDLNGAKHSAQGKRYWLTFKTLPFQIVRTYGLAMRPIEKNIQYGLPGAQLRLYDTKNSAKRIENPVCAADRRLHYELYTYDWRRLLPYALREALAKMKNRVRRFFR